MRLLTCLFLLLLAAPLAAAQGAPTTDLLVAIEPGPFEIAPGQGQAIPYTVSLDISGIVCTGSGSGTITFEVTPTGMSAMPSVDSIDDLTFSIPQGAYGVLGQPAFSYASGEQTLQIEVGADAPGDHEMTYPFEASFNGETGCESQGTVPSDSAAFLVRVRTPPAPADDSLPTTTGEPLQQTQETEESPGLAVPVLGAALLVFALRRR